MSWETGGGSVCPRSLLRACLRAAGSKEVGVVTAAATLSPTPLGEATFVHEWLMALLLGKNIGSSGYTQVRLVASNTSTD